MKACQWLSHFVVANEWIQQNLKGLYSNSVKYVIGAVPSILSGHH